MPYTAYERCIALLSSVKPTIDDVSGRKRVDALVDDVDDLFVERPGPANTKERYRERREGANLQVNNQYFVRQRTDPSDYVTRTHQGGAPT